MAAVASPSELAVVVGGSWSTAGRTSLPGSTGALPSAFGGGRGTSSGRPWLSPSAPEGSDEAWLVATSPPASVPFPVVSSPAFCASASLHRPEREATWLPSQPDRVTGNTSPGCTGACQKGKHRRSDSLGPVVRRVHPPQRCAGQRKSALASTATDSGRFRARLLKVGHLHNDAIAAIVNGILESWYRRSRRGANLRSSRRAYHRWVEGNLLLTTMSANRL